MSATLQRILSGIGSVALIALLTAAWPAMAASPLGAGEFAVTGTSQGGGLVTPGQNPVYANACDTVLITPDRGCQLTALTDNLTSDFPLVTPGMYAIPDVQASHTVAGTFAKSPFTVSLSAPANGTVTGLVNVSAAFTSPQALSAGDTVVFTITPAASYAIGTVSVDGVSYPAAAWGGSTSTGTFTLPNVRADHSIVVTFVYTVVQSDLIVMTDPNGNGFESIYINGVSVSSASNMYQWEGAVYSTDTVVILFFQRSSFYLGEIVDSFNGTNTYPGALYPYTMTNIRCDHRVFGVVDEIP